MNCFERHGFRYRVAEPGDDQAIAGLLNDNAIPGWIALSYRTQPGWHRPLCGSTASATIIGTRISDGKPGGIATRSVHPSYHGGRSADVGWLGQLRIDPEFRNRPHVLRSGFDAVRTFLHDPAQTPWYLASIISGNDTARRILEADLDGFPRFEPLFEYRTFAFSTAAPSRSRASRFAPRVLTRWAGSPTSSMSRTGNATSHRALPAPQFAEVAAGRDRRLAISWFTKPRHAGGVAAIWDQRAYRSIVADSAITGRSLRRAPLANLLPAASGLPLCRRRGAGAAPGLSALAAVAGDEPEIWRDLIAAALAQARGAAPICSAAALHR